MLFGFAEDKKQRSLCWSAFTVEQESGKSKSSCPPALLELCMPPALYNSSGAMELPYEYQSQQRSGGVEQVVDITLLRKILRKEVLDALGAFMASQSPVLEEQPKGDYTTQQVCALLNIHHHTARRLRCGYQLGGKGGQFRFSRAEIDHAKLTGKLPKRI